MDFWENLTRYPRFFISSCVGLVLVILSPFQKFGKTKTSLTLIIILLVALVSFISISLYLMTNSDY